MSCNKHYLYSLIRLTNPRTINDFWFIYSRTYFTSHIFHIEFMYSIVSAVIDFFNERSVQSLMIEH